MTDRDADRLAIPSSSMTEQDARRNRQYHEEATNQDWSDADDAARDRGLGSDASGTPPKGRSGARGSDD